MRVSVLIPVYNGSQFLRQSLESILCQTWTDFELLLIDDCSTDSSTEIIAEFAERDPRIRAVYHAKNLGLAGTLNEGLRLAKGTYVARLDHDDEALPDRLRIQVEFLDSHPEVVLVGGSYVNMGLSPNLDRLCSLPTSPDEISRILPRENCICHPAVMMRRQIVLDAGGYRQEFRNAEDYDLWLRLSRVGPLANVSQPVIRYRLTTSGMSYSRRWEQLRYVFLAQESFRSPDVPIEGLEGKVEELLAACDRTYFFDCVARHSVSELQSLGFAEEARQMFLGFETELSESCRADLNASLSRIDAPANRVEPSGATRGAVTVTPSRPASSLVQSLIAGLLFLIPSVLWIFRDQTVWPWDQAWYGEVSVDLWWTLVHDARQWWDLMLAAFGIKAPGVAWLGQFFVPLSGFLGSTERVLLISVVLTQYAALVLQFQIGSKLWNDDARGGWIAAAWLAASPLFVALTHQFLVEPLQLLAITYFYWTAIHGESRSRMWWAGHSLLASSLAMIAKATSPLYLFIPSLLICYHFARARRWVGAAHRDRLLESVLLLAGLASAGLTFRWYWQNQQTLREFVQLASSSEVALNYGQRPEFFSKWSFWLHAFMTSFIPSIFGLALLGVLACAGLPFVRGTKGQTTPRRTLLFLVIGSTQVLLVLAVFTRQINEENRYLLPVATAWICVLVGLLARYRSTPVFAATLALALAQWAWGHSIALGFSSWSPRVTYWLHPANPDPAKKTEIENVVSATTERVHPFRYNISGFEAEWLNANSLSFYAAKHRLDVGFRSYYTSLGYAATETAPAWERMESLNIRYFISLAAEHQPSPPNFVNQISLPFLERLRKSSEFRPTPFHSELGIVIFERIPDEK